MIYLVVLSALYASALKTSLDYDGCHWRFSAASDFRTPEMVQKKDRIREKI